jgi:hypothetical protein
VGHRSIMVGRDGTVVRREDTMASILDEVRAYAKEHEIDFNWVLTCFYWRGTPQERGRITRELNKEEAR